MVEAAPRRDRGGTEVAARPAARSHRTTDETSRDGGRTSRRKGRPAPEERQTPRKKVMDLERVGRGRGGVRGAGRGDPRHGFSRRRRWTRAGGRAAVTAKRGRRGGRRK